MIQTKFRQIRTEEFLIHWPWFEMKMEHSSYHCYSAKIYSCQQSAPPTTLPHTAETDRQPWGHRAPSCTPWRTPRQKPTHSQRKNKGPTWNLSEIILSVWPHSSTVLIGVQCEQVLHMVTLQHASWAHEDVSIGYSSPHKSQDPKWHLCNSAFQVKIK